MWSALASIFLVGCSANVLTSLPAIPFKATSGEFDVSRLRNIVVDATFAGARDDAGLTLIPPSLSDFAHTFASDIKTSLGESVSVRTSTDCDDYEIFLTVGNDTSFVDAAGRWTSEGYSLIITPSRITITGASPLGVWWGTRSILQQAILNDGKITAGSGSDAPGWGIRGLMLDVARHYYPPDFVVELCAWMSFWKQNVFHIHLSDNLYNNPNYTYEQTMDLYARFRLWSDEPALAGLNKHRNESYTRDDFDHMQQACAARGVTMLPEIESPGHALVISQWKPELGLDGALDLLNITYPDTIPTVEKIWQTFLPWMQSRRVSIGADEYVDDQLSPIDIAESYNYFVNTMNKFVDQEADNAKVMQIWGTFPPNASYSNQVNKSIPVQHWEYFEDNPLFDYVDNGIQVINSDDSVYIVQKYSTSYPQHLNRTLMFHGNPATGGQFAPFVFDPNNVTNNPLRSNPLVLGHIAPQWNDYGANTSTYLEAYYSWRDLNAALASTQWGVLPSEADYDAIFERLQAKTPGQNLDRVVRSKGDVIFQYNFSRTRPYSYGSHGHRKGLTVEDHSPNGHNAITDCATTNGALQLRNECKLTTPLGSKGHDYTLSFSVRPTSSTPGPLFSGPDSELWAGNGTSSNVTFITAGYAFALNYTLPVDTWTQADVIARGNHTYLSVDNGEEMEFLAVLGINGERHQWANIAIVAPLHTVGGGAFEGAIKDIKLVDHA